VIGGDNPIEGRENEIILLLPPEMYEQSVSKTKFEKAAVEVRREGN
jgi:hypothetical protein